MKYYYEIICVSFLTIFSACSSKANKHEKELKKSELPDSVALANKLAQQNKLAITEDIVCVRGQAEPVLNKKYFPATTFILQPDSLSGIETVSLKNGDKLIITNWGCESYVLTFRFETARFKADSSQLSYWYTVAGKLMKEVLPGIDAPLDIKAGVRALNNYAAKNAKHLKLQSEISFSGDEAVRIVSLDSISKTRNNRIAVTLSFTAGLL